VVSFQELFAAVAPVCDFEQALAGLARSSVAPATVVDEPETPEDREPPRLVAQSIHKLPRVQIRVLDLR
jgi:hypothetical protein